MIVKEGQ